MRSPQRSQPRRGRSRTGSVSCLTLLLSCTLAGCDASYDLRGPAPSKGARVRTETTARVRDGSATISTPQGVVSATAEGTWRSVEDVEYLEVEGRRVTNFTQAVVQDVSKWRIVGGGLPAGADEEVRGPLEGEVVLHEFAGGTWSKRLSDTKPGYMNIRRPLSGGPMPRVDPEVRRKVLLRLPSWESDDPLYPEGKVKVGHRWTVDGPSLRRFLGSEFLSADGSASFTFEEVADHGGEKCARLAVTLQAAGRMLDHDNQEVSFQFGGSGTVYRSLATGLDRKMTLSGQWAGAGVLVSEGAATPVAIRGPVEVEIVCGPAPAQALGRPEFNPEFKWPPWFNRALTAAAVLAIGGLICRRAAK